MGAPSSYDASVPSTAALTALLAESLPHVQDNAFHPVLYQTLAALHGYIGLHQQQLLDKAATITKINKYAAMVHGDAEETRISSCPTATTTSIESVRPCFSKNPTPTTVTGTSLHTNHECPQQKEDVLAFGWLESCSFSSSWEQVLLLLVANGTNKGPHHLQIVREQFTSSSSSDSSSHLSSLEILYQIPLDNSTFSMRYVDLYGDPRLVLRDSEEKVEFTLRCDSAASAMAWVQYVAKEGKEPNHGPAYRLGVVPTASSDVPFDEESGLGELDDDASNFEPLMEEEGVEVEMDDQDNNTDIVHADSIRANQTSSTDMLEAAINGTIDEEENEEDIMDAPATKSPPLLQQTMKDHPQVNPIVQSQQPQRQAKTSNKQVAEEKLQEMEHVASSNLEKVHATKTRADPPSSHDNNFRQATTAAAAKYTAMLNQNRTQAPATKVGTAKTIATTTTSSAPTTPTPPYASAAVRAEQEKKMAAERRRQDLALQRSLAAAEHKVKESLKNLKFFQTEKRKKELVAQAAIGQRTGVTNKDLAEQLKQIERQIHATETLLKDKRAEVVKIKAEIQQRKHQALQPQQPPIAEVAVNHLQNRMTEQARKEQALEDQKKAAAEQRRKEMEEQRRRLREQQKRAEEKKKQRFLELEERKEKLKHDAMNANPSTDDAAILRRMSNEISGLGDVERKRSQESAHSNNSKGAESAQSPKPQRPSSQQDSGQEEANASTSTFSGMDFDPLRSHAGSSHQSPPPTPIIDHRHRASPPPPSPVISNTEAVTDDNSESDFDRTELKRNIIVQWALQPPNMQSLRPIDHLLQTVQSVYPPNNGVAAHPHFGGWEPIQRDDLLTQSGCLDEKKLQKAVRKLKFFLHPDKLPRDLSEEQVFVCELLWDITNDAWEEYEKAQEELDWMK